MGAIPTAERLERFYRRVAKAPRAWIAAGLVAVAAVSVWASRLEINSDGNAFLPASDPAVARDRETERMFGLGASISLLVVNDEPAGIFNPHSLALVSWLTERIQALPEVGANAVASLVTEHGVSSGKEGLWAAPFLERTPRSDEEAVALRRAVMDFEPFVGRLVSEDGRATSIVIEPVRPSAADRLYQELQTLLASAPIAGERVFIGGDGAVSSQLGRYINSDMGRLNFLCGLIITVVLWLSYRTWQGIAFPMVVVASTVGTVLGAMALAGEPFYIITNALPVILIAVGVADGIHILGQYYEEQSARPAAAHIEWVVRAMRAVWRPVTITSATDAAGFLALSVASDMPPMRAFGLYAALGVGVAWLFSVMVLPAWLILFPHAPRARDPAADAWGRFMAVLSRFVTGRHRAILFSSAALTAVAAAGAAMLQVNEDRIRNFRADEPIVQASRQMNARLGGSTPLYIVCRTPGPEGWFNPRRLQALDALEQGVRELPHVGGSLSIAGILKEIHRAMSDNQDKHGALPASEALIAQYFLLHSAAAGQGALTRLIDYDYQTANIRVDLRSGEYRHEKQVVEAARSLVAASPLSDLGVEVSLSGRASFDSHWIGRLGASHFRSVLVALLAVGITLSIGFRSARTGALALLPVSLAILMIYAVMGYAGVWLNIGTSMFAAIAIGAGVDFSVYTIDRLKSLIERDACDVDEAVHRLFPSTGRALLFNFLAVFLGFGLLMTSEVPPLIRFGVLTAVSVAASFLGAFTLPPALIKRFGPARFGIKKRTAAQGGPKLIRQIA